jgi:hypothetical protein
VNAGCDAALLLLFDIRGDAIAEHDQWHSHEHLPERLAIPGFVRGSRWTAPVGTPRYLVLYEVRDLAVLDSQSYLERLNRPTPWTTKMMACYVGMQRGLCRVVARSGAGLGSTALLVRFTPAAGRTGALHGWLSGRVLPELAQRPGLASALLLEAAQQPAMTREQQIRGRDAAVQSALLVTGYDGGAVAALAQGELRADHFAAHGAVTSGHACSVFHNAITITAPEVAGRGPNLNEGAP